MALQFNCQHCNELIISKFLKVGELAECKKCGEKNTIPKSAEGISESEIKSEHTISDAFDDGSKKQSNSKTIEVSATQSHNANEVIITDIKMSHICSDCGTNGKPEKLIQGQFPMELLLWGSGILVILFSKMLFGFWVIAMLPGVFYTIWRVTTKYDGCKVCNSKNIVPLDSPKGKELSNRNKPQIEDTKTINSEPMDVKSELKKYKEMLDEDLITQEQYDTKSKELLGL